MFNRKEYQKEYGKEYRKRNREKINKYLREYMKRPEVVERMKGSRKIEKAERFFKKMKEMEKTPKGKYRIYKNGAKKRELEWSLTFDQFISFWQKPCLYCGSKIETIGIDRVDSEKGYIYDNCVSCCKVCNKMKGKLSKDEFVKQCKRVMIWTKLTKD